MPKVKTNRVKIPEGWELIEPTLRELQAKMREGCCLHTQQSLLSFFFFLRSNNKFNFLNSWNLRFYVLSYRTAENDPHDGKRKCETLWPIFKIAHQKSRYIFDLYYRRKEISKELYEFCLDQGYADRNLIAKWKKVCLVISVWIHAYMKCVVFYLPCMGLYGGHVYNFKKIGW